MKKSNSSSSFFYNIPPVASKRSTFIGYGTKSDFTKMNGKHNAPYYNLRHPNDSTHWNAPKITFGIARDFYTKVDVEGKTGIIDTISPGPAKYNYWKPFGSYGPKYTMTRKYVWTALDGKTNTPGPAQYSNNIQINPEGRYTLSRYSSTPRTGWSLSHSKRFNYQFPQTPGANAYKLENLINGNGNWYNSRFTSAASKTISKRYKTGYDIENTTPGPGSYQTFSEWGIYRSKDADKFDKKVMSKTTNSSFYKNRTIKVPSKASSRCTSVIEKRSNNSRDPNKTPQLSERKEPNGENKKFTIKAENKAQTINSESKDQMINEEKEESKEPNMND